MRTTTPPPTNYIYFVVRPYAGCAGRGGVPSSVKQSSVTTFSQQIRFFNLISSFHAIRTYVTKVRIYISSQVRHMYVTKGTYAFIYISRPTVARSPARLCSEDGKMYVLLAFDCAVLPNFVTLSRYRTRQMLRI